MQRKKGAGEGGGRGWGASKTRREGPSKGIYPRGVSGACPDEAQGRGWEEDLDASRDPGRMPRWEPLMENHDA